MRAGIALGSNLGDRLASLKAARKRIEGIMGVKPPIMASAVYETAPVGCEPGSGNFLNAVIEVGFDGDARLWLATLREIEGELGRPSHHPRNTSRTIDLDLLYFGELAVDTEELQLPHPRLHKRPFVLAPLADLRPELLLPGQNETVAALLAKLPDAAELVRLAAEW